MFQQINYQEYKYLNLYIANVYDMYFNEVQKRIFHASIYLTCIKKKKIPCLKLLIISNVHSLLYIKTRIPDCYIRIITFLLHFLNFISPAQNISKEQIFLSFSGKNIKNLIFYVLNINIGIRGHKIALLMFTRV